MTHSRPFRFLEPTFFAGLLDDPLLLVRIRPLGESCLFDCGQLHHLAKRVVKSVTALFITHAHMDHFMGLDTFIRHNHVTPKTFDIFGPPGIAAKVGAKLASYDWNLTEPDFCTFRVREIHPERTLTYLYPGAEGFPCRFSADTPRSSPEIYRNRFLDVRGAFCDHRIPSLIYRLTERPSFQVDEARIEQLGLVRGEWLKALKKGFYSGFPGPTELRVLRRRGEVVSEEEVSDAEALYKTICRATTPASIGYVTDISAGADDLAQVAALLEGVTLLVCECTFLTAERHKATASYHLTTADLNRLADRLRPRFLLPMHFSKSYAGQSEILYHELEMPAGTTILRLPEHLTPRPLLLGEVPKLAIQA